MTCIEERKNAYVVYFVCVVVTSFSAILCLNVLHEAKNKDGRLVLLSLLYIIVILL